MMTAEHVLPGFSYAGRKSRVRKEGHYRGDNRRHVTSIRGDRVHYRIFGTKRKYTCTMSQFANWMLTRGEPVDAIKDILASRHRQS